VRNALNAYKLQCIGTSATLAGPGSLEEQRRRSPGGDHAVWRYVQPEHIISETLRRAAEHNQMIAFLNRLAQRVAAPQAVPTDYESLRHDPLASWIESNLGLTTEAISGRLIRARPRSISGQDGAAHQLSTETGLPESRCAEALTRLLMAGYDIPNPETSLPTFAFRLHQFISRGDTVYASLEAENTPFDVYGQQSLPGDR
jgi:hypothetical protein